MEQIIDAFAAALVAAMATDAWSEAHAAVVALWRRLRKQQADDTDRALKNMREMIITARAAGQADTEQALARVWQGRLQELLLESPSAVAAELKEILERTLIPMLAPEERNRISQIIMTGRSYDTSTFNQFVGNQTNFGR